jgi:FkbM family methyltransferase
MWSRIEITYRGPLAAIVPPAFAQPRLGRIDNLQRTGVSSSMLHLLTRPEALRALALWPKFSLTSYRIVSSLKRQGLVPGTVIDVGANVGQFAVACAKMFPGVSVHSFEPLPECVLQLRKSAAKLPEIHVYPVALGSSSGDVSIHVNAFRHSSSVLSLGERHRKAFPAAREIGTIEVPMSTLDQQMGSAVFRGPVLLKLDVQGFESEVLEGASDTLLKVDYVVVESSFRPLYEGEKTFVEILKMLGDRGYEFLRPLGWLEDPRNDEILQMDALFVRSSGNL